MGSSTAPGTVRFFPVYRTNTGPRSTVIPGSPFRGPGSTVPAPGEGEASYTFRIVGLAFAAKYPQAARGRITPARDTLPRRALRGIATCNFCEFTT